MDYSQKDRGTLIISLSVYALTFRVTEKALQGASTAFVNNPILTLWTVRLCVFARTAMHGPSTDAARFARSLNSVNNQAEVWRQLKAYAAPFGFDHLTVLKRTDDLPQRITKAIVTSTRRRALPRSSTVKASAPTTP